MKFALLSFFVAAVVCATTVTINTDTVVNVNGYTTIQPQIFGLTTYGSSGYWTNGQDAENYVTTYGVESIGFGSISGKLLPKGSPLSLSALKSYFEDPNGAEKTFTEHDAMGQVFKNGALSRSNVEQWAYLKTPDGSCSSNVQCDSTGNIPVDFDWWTLFMTQYVKLIRKVNPNVKYFHLWNEPNAHFWRAGKDGDYYASFYKQVVSSIKQENPGINIGGPVTWCPPTYGKTWLGYTKPLMDAALPLNTLDHIDFHSYKTPNNVQNLLGEIHTITAYAKTEHGKWLRSAITETQVQIDTQADFDNWKAHYNQRTFETILLTFNFLRHPDKISARQIFDFGVSGLDRFNGTSAIPITPEMAMYQAMKPMRGTRVMATSQSDSLLVEASTTSNTLNIGIVNTEENSQEIFLSIPNLSLSHGTMYVLNSTRLYKFGHSLQSSQSFQVPPKSLTVLSVATNFQDTLKDTYSVNEYFFDCVMVDTSKNSGTVNCTANANPSNAKTATLRFGVTDACSTTWKVSINNREHSFSDADGFNSIPLSNVVNGQVQAEFSWSRNTCESSIGVDGIPTLNYFRFASLVFTSQ